MYDTIHVAFIAIVFFYAMFERVLEIQAGVVFSGFFKSLFVFGSDHKVVDLLEYRTFMPITKP